MFDVAAFKQDPWRRFRMHSFAAASSWMQVITHNNKNNLSRSETAYSISITVLCA
jgi:hypothetical protein